jgi:Rab-GTPase-TBC domain
MVSERKLRSNSVTRRTTQLPITSNSSVASAATEPMPNAASKSSATRRPEFRRLARRDVASVVSSSSVVTAASSSQADDVAAKPSVTLRRPQAAATPPVDSPKPSTLAQAAQEQRKRRLANVVDHKMSKESNPPVTVQEQPKTAAPVQNVASTNVSQPVAVEQPIGTKSSTSMTERQRRLNPSPESSLFKQSSLEEQHVVAKKSVGSAAAAVKERRLQRRSSSQSLDTAASEPVAIADVQQQHYKKSVGSAAAALKELRMPRRMSLETKPDESEQQPVAGPEVPDLRVAAKKSVGSAAAAMKDLRVSRRLSNQSVETARPEASEQVPAPELPSKTTTAAKERRRFPSLEPAFIKRSASESSLPVQEQQRILLKKSVKELRTHRRLSNPSVETAVVTKAGNSLSGAEQGTAPTKEVSEQHAKKTVVSAAAAMKELRIHRRLSMETPEAGESLGSSVEPAPVKQVSEKHAKKSVVSLVHRRLSNQSVETAAATSGESLVSGAHSAPAKEVLAPEKNEKKTVASAAAAMKELRMHCRLSNQPVETTSSLLPKPSESLVVPGAAAEQADLTTPLATDPGTPKERLGHRRYGKRSIASPRPLPKRSDSESSLFDATPVTVDQTTAVAAATEQAHASTLVPALGPPRGRAATDSPMSQQSASESLHSSTTPGAEHSERIMTNTSALVATNRKQLLLKHRGRSTSTGRNRPTTPTASPGPVSPVAVPDAAPPLVLPDPVDDHRNYVVPSFAIAASMGTSSSKPRARSAERRNDEVKARSRSTGPSNDEVLPLSPQRRSRSSHSVRSPVSVEQVLAVAAEAASRRTPTSGCSPSSSSYSSPHQVRTSPCTNCSPSSSYKQRAKHILREKFEQRSLSADRVNEAVEAVAASWRKTPPVAKSDDVDSVESIVHRRRSSTPRRPAASAELLPVPPSWRELDDDEEDDARSSATISGLVQRLQANTERLRLRSLSRDSSRSASIQSESTDGEPLQSPVHPLPEVEMTARESCWAEPATPVALNQLDEQENTVPPRDEEHPFLDATTSEVEEKGATDVISCDWVENTGIREEPASWDPPGAKSDWVDHAVASEDHSWDPSRVTFFATTPDHPAKDAAFGGWRDETFSPTHHTREHDEDEKKETDRSWTLRDDSFGFTPFSKEFLPPDFRTNDVDGSRNSDRHLDDRSCDTQKNADHADDVSHRHREDCSRLQPDGQFLEPPVVSPALDFAEEPVDGSKNDFSVAPCGSPSKEDAIVEEEETDDQATESLLFSATGHGSDWIADSDPLNNQPVSTLSKQDRIEQYATMEEDLESDVERDDVPEDNDDEEPSEVEYRTQLSDTEDEDELCINTNPVSFPEPISSPEMPPTFLPSFHVASTQMIASVNSEDPSSATQRPVELSVAPPPPPANVKKKTKNKVRPPKPRGFLFAESDDAFLSQQSSAIMASVLQLPPPPPPPGEKKKKSKVKSGRRQPTRPATGRAVPLLAPPPAEKLKKWAENKFGPMEYRHYETPGVQTGGSPDKNISFTENTAEKRDVFDEPSGHPAVSLHLGVFDPFGGEHRLEPELELMSSVSVGSVTASMPEGVVSSDGQDNNICPKESREEFPDFLSSPSRTKNFFSFDQGQVEVEESETVELDESSHRSSNSRKLNGVAASGSVNKAFEGDDTASRTSDVAGPMTSVSFDHSQLNSRNSYMAESDEHSYRSPASKGAKSIASAISFFDSTIEVEAISGVVSDALELARSSLSVMTDNDDVDSVPLVNTEEEDVPAIPNDQAPSALASIPMHDNDAKLVIASSVFIDDEPPTQLTDLSRCQSSAAFIEEEGAETLEQVNGGESVPAKSDIRAEPSPLNRVDGEASSVLCQMPGNQTSEVGSTSISGPSICSPVHGRNSNRVAEEHSIEIVGNSTDQGPTSLAHEGINGAAQEMLVESLARLPLIAFGAPSSPEPPRDYSDDMLGWLVDQVLHDSKLKKSYNKAFLVSHQEKADYLRQILSNEEHFTNLCRFLANRVNHPDSLVKVEPFTLLHGSNPTLSVIMATNFVRFLESVSTFSSVRSPFGETNPFLIELLTASRRADGKPGKASMPSLVLDHPHGNPELLVRFAFDVDRTMPCISLPHAAASILSCDSESTCESCHPLCLRSIIPQMKPSPFERFVDEAPPLLGKILSFVGDPALICRMKLVSRNCKISIDQDAHRLIQEAIRAGGLTANLRPAFWLWISLDKLSPSAQLPAESFLDLVDRGRATKWSNVIERDVLRSFGNLPPHKTGARLRTDSIVRALVSWGRNRIMKSGVKGSGEPPGPPCHDDQDESDDMTPTETVSEWGGVSPVGSVTSGSVGAAGVTSSRRKRFMDDLALGGSTLTPESKMVLQEKLSSILHALAAKHEDVGYCQGMDYIVAHLLRVLQDTIRWKAARGDLSRVIDCKPSKIFDPRSAASDDQVQDILAEIDRSCVIEETCFRVMDSFLTTFGLCHFYWPELRCLKTCCFVFEKLIKTKLPVLADHFEHHDLNVGLFALGWFQTLFLYLPSMPSATVCHMWDIW